MSILVFSHPASLRHRPPAGHPERPERFEAMMTALAGHEVALRPAPEATDDDLRPCHPQAYLDRLARAAPAAEAIALDPDTWLSPGTLEAARRSAGAALAAVDAVMTGQVRRALVAARPPGHHALASRPMGFCLFGNVALAARRVIDRHGAERVAIVDFDVHHGNGTEALVESDPRILFCSTHQWPFWPGTGEASHEGPHGTVVNVPLPAGTEGPAFRAAVAERILPRLRAHRPDLVLISAGFDAHRADPLGGLALETEDFRWITREIAAIAQDHAQGRVVSCVEGGYDLAALRDGVGVHLAALGET
ncbi:histone deacetylase family protein [Rubellimicrobium sp. CFH 75288]|uniref:histone deacetylase family protein n=1 Tax=Rubellimicrobium sp. CFH 75288 TaxID=2697034 RepID=UPI00141292B4|nr:histone deacetylase family protein [Rubellimicrobium sp. CFH 75288]NAZ36844.1 histone deacetylase family protein [Rubellimicrobium sp. CFH 75288]